MLGEQSSISSHSALPDSNRVLHGAQPYNSSSMASPFGDDPPASASPQLYYETCGSSILDQIKQKIKQLMAMRANIDAQLSVHQRQYALAWAQQESNASLDHTFFPSTGSPSYHFYTPVSLANPSLAIPVQDQNSPDIFVQPNASWHTTQDQPCDTLGAFSNYNQKISVAHSTQNRTITEQSAASSSSSTYTTQAYQGRKVFHCECGHKTNRKGDMTRHRQSRKHSEPSYSCHCGVVLQRPDVLKRHQERCDKVRGMP